MNDVNIITILLTLIYHVSKSSDYAVNLWVPRICDYD